MPVSEPTWVDFHCTPFTSGGGNNPPAYYTYPGTPTSPGAGYVLCQHVPTEPPTPPPYRDGWSWGDWATLPPAHWAVYSCSPLGGTGDPPRPGSCRTPGVPGSHTPVYECHSPTGAASFHWECPVCPFLWHYEEESQKCHTGPGCPEGACHCGATGACVTCTPPACAAELHCLWNNDTCEWDCDEPSCPPDQYWDWTSCTCAPCPPGECYCATTGSCISCPPPDCAEELNCTWNTATCVWDCDTPSCPAGQTWYPIVCGCRTDCPAGQCWCEATGICVGCPEPDCKAELHCQWNILTCVWDCDDPEAPGYCGAGTWNPETCRCEGNQGALWNYMDRHQRYHVASTTAVAGIRYQRSDVSIPPFVIDVMATSDAADAAPRMVCDHRDAIHLVYERGANVLLSLSHDDGLTFADGMTLFTGASRPTVVQDPATGAMLYAAYKAGVLVGRIQYPGDAAPGPEFAFDDDGGVDLAVEDDSFQIAPAHEGPNRWLLVCRLIGTTDATSLQSWDNARSWTEVP